MHGPNGTAITETDTTTLGGADNYKKIHDSKGAVGPKQIDLGGGKNTFLDNKNSSAGCKPLPHFISRSILAVTARNNLLLQGMSHGGCDEHVFAVV